MLFVRVSQGVSIDRVDVARSGPRLFLAQLFAAFPILPGKNSGKNSTTLLVRDRERRQAVEPGAHVEQLAADVVPLGERVALVAHPRGDEGLGHACVHEGRAAGGAKRVAAHRALTPGVYEVSFEGVGTGRFLPIPTRRVDLREGETTEVIVELHRK